MIRVVEMIVFVVGEAEFDADSVIVTETVVSSVTVAGEGEAVTSSVMVW